MAFLGAAPFFTAWLFLIRYHFFLYLYTAKPAYGWLWGFINTCVFFFTTGRRKELKRRILVLQLFLILLNFSNYTNYIHIFITCPLFPTGYFFAADLSTG